MKKTKLLTSLVALALVVGLGACEVNVGDINIGGDSSETTGDTTEGGDGEVGEKTPAPEEGRYFLGFDVDGTVNYIDGGTVTGYDREGTLTTNIGLAVPVTLAAADGDNAYYLTFELNEATNYICIVNVDTYVNLQYLTTPTPIYWDETYAAWVNAEDTYFLCYNSTYKCAYASAFTDWWGSSPVGELFDIPEDWEPSEQEELPSSEVTYVGDVVEGTYKFGAFDTTSWSYLYISTGVSTASNHYLIPTSDWTYGANISITSYEDGYTLSYELGEQTRYITYTGSSTAVTTSTQPYVWYYDSENTVFTSAAENGRFLGLAANADAFRAFSYTNDGLTKYAHAIPYTTEPVPEENPNTGDDDDGSAYKLGAADPATGTYYYFDGAALSTQYGSYLNVTTSWDEAAEVTITDLSDGGQSLSFIDSDGAKKYISWSSSTAVDFADEPYTWYWSETINGFYNLANDSDTSGRFLAYYASTPSFRAYSPTEQYLAYGHVAAYTEEPEAITPEPEPEDEFPFEVGKDYFLGYDRSGTIYYYNGEVLQTYYGDVSTDISKAAKVTLGASGDKYTLKLENGKYLGADFGDHANFKWDLETAYEWEYNSTYQTFVAYNSSNTAYCLGTSGTYNEITLFTLSSAASNYPATLYEIPEDWAPYEEPEVDEESFEEVKTGKLGLFQENKNAYYYFTGAKDGNFGAMSTNWEQGVDVTLLTDQTYYYIRFTSNGQTLYFGHTDSSNSQVALNDSPYPLQYDETHGAYLNTDGSRFLGTYNTYETLSWSEVSYINNSGQFIATIYETQPDIGGGDEGENEGNEDETLVGTLTFLSANTAASTTAFSTSTLQTCLTKAYSGTGTITAGDTVYTYPGSNGSGDGLKGNADCIQLGGSNGGGNFAFTLNDTDTITRVSVKVLYYDAVKNMTVNENAISINYNSTSYSSWDDVPEVEYTLTATTSFNFSVSASKNRMLIHSIEFYSA